MTRIKHEAMVGIDTDMCNLPENDTYNYHIMAYHKDVTGEILNTVPSQPNLLITHKNSMYMSGYWDSSSSVLSWRLLNLGDGSDILTTTTTTTTPRPTQYIINGSFAYPLYFPEIVMVDPNGDERIVDVEFKNPSSDTFEPSYDAYVVTTTFNPEGCVLKVRGQDSLWLNQVNYWAGEMILPSLSSWQIIQDGDYLITQNFTSLTLTTTTTTTTTTAAPVSYEYTINVSSTNVTLSSLDLIATSSTGTRKYCVGIKSGSSWSFSFVMPTYITSGWTFEFSGINTAGRNSYTAILSGQTFSGLMCTISSLRLTQDSGMVTSPPSLSPTLSPIFSPVIPLSLDDPEDTNSLDDAINDYLNE